MAKLKHYKKLVFSIRFAIEIEVAFPGKESKIDELDKHYRKFFKNWTVTTDTTIEPEGREFKPKDSHKLYYNKISFQELKDVLAVIKANGGEINKTTGSHIHLDMKKFSSKEIIKIIKEIIAKEKYISENFKVSSHRLKETCKPLTKYSIRNLTPELLDAFRKDDDNEDFEYCPALISKYFFVNLGHLKDIGTLEFRFFEGTLSWKEIQKRVKFLLDFLINSLERE